MFIAILTEAYTAIAKENTADDDLDFKVLNNMKRRFTAMVKKGLNRSSLNVADLDLDGDGKLDAEELAKAAKVSVGRAKELIRRHDKDGDGKLDEREFETFKQRLVEEEARRKRTDREALEQLEDKVDRLADMLRSVMPQAAQQQQELQARASQLLQPQPQQGQNGHAQQHTIDSSVFDLDVVADIADQIEEMEHSDDDGLY